MLELSEVLAGHVRELAGRIGIRYIGSPGNHATGEYIRRQMEQAGLSVEVQEFACPDWLARKTVCELDGQPLPMYVNPFSPPVELTAVVVSACTMTELERLDMSGKIVLLYGDLMKEPVSPISWFLKTERDDRIICLLESKAPAAVLSTQPGVPYFAHGFCDADFPVPSATLPRESALRILRRATPKLRLMLETERRPGSTANVVGRKPGTRAETVVLCAHYDTATGTLGACDNAGGVAILLALAAHWADLKLEYGLEFVAFSGHEYLPLGDDVYWQTASADQFVAAINFDGAGHLLGANSLTAMAASGELIRMAQSKLGAYAGAVWVEPWPESNHTPFAMRGVPALAFSSVGAREVAHSAADAPDGVSPAKLNEAASLAAEIVIELQEKTLDWLREHDGTIPIGR